jgi:hypothetical protein
MFTLKHTTAPIFELSHKDAPKLGGFDLPATFVGCSKFDGRIAISLDASRYAWIEAGDTPALHVADTPGDGAFEVLGRKFSVSHESAPPTVSITSDSDCLDLHAFCFGTVGSGDRIDVGNIKVDGTGVKKVNGIEIETVRL